MSNCTHGNTKPIHPDAHGNCVECLLCGARTKMPSITIWSNGPFNPLTDEQIEALQKHPCFNEVGLEMFSAIVKHIEWEHGISPNQRTVRMGVGRIKAELPA